MTFAEAARIMMSGSPVIEPLTITSNGEYTAPKGVHGYNPILVSVGDNGIWEAIQKEPPLVSITLSPNVSYYVLEMGNLIGTFMSEGLYNGTRYVNKKGYNTSLVGAIKIHGSPVYYHIISSGYGLGAENNYTYLNDALYQTFERKIKLSAINASSMSLYNVWGIFTFKATVQWYQDCLNFQQPEYSDGSHWEEKYAWCSTYPPQAATISLDFQELPVVKYSDQIRGNTIEEKYTNWSSVCSDIFNAPSGVFPVLSYTASEDHFSNDLYLNDDAKNRGYYDNNVAYMEKWGKPDLWA